MRENPSKYAQKHRTYFKTLIVLVLAILVIETLLYVSFLWDRLYLKLTVTSKHTSNQYMEVEWGGSYSPKYQGKDNVAIIVPYSTGLESQLYAFLLHMHPFLMKQGLEYTIFVVQFHDITIPFNRGALANIGARHVHRPPHSRWRCLAVHDATVVPLDSRARYACSRRPRVLATVVDGRELSATEALGGVLLMTPEQFVDIDGFSNHYWKKGEENADLARRLADKGYEIETLNSTIGRYRRLEDLHFHQNWQNMNSSFVPAAVTTTNASDGLSAFRYDATRAEPLRLCTRVVATVGGARPAPSMAGRLSDRALAYYLYLDYLIK